MQTSLSPLVDNLSEIFSKECKGCKSKLNYISFKDNQLIFQCSKYKKNYQNDFNKELIKKFIYMHQFCNGDSKFVLLLRKGVYPWIAGKDLMKRHY